jgi:hypothetical protein
MADDRVLKLLQEMLAEEKEFRAEMRLNFAKPLDQLDRIAALHRPLEMGWRGLAPNGPHRRTS